MFVDAQRQLVQAHAPAAKALLQTGGGKRAQIADGGDAQRGQLGFHHFAHAGQATDGLAVDYDGVMQLHAVQSASGRVPADCPLLDVPASPASQ